MAKIYHYSGETSISQIFNTLKTEITKAFDVGETNNWTVAVEQPGYIIFKMISEPNGNSVTQTAYIKFGKYTAGTAGENNHLVVSYSDALNSGGTDLETPSPLSYLTIWINAGTAGVFKRTSDMLFNYDISMDNDNLSIVLSGDKTMDYTTHYVSYLYFGTIDSFNSGDTDGGVALTCGTTDQMPTYGGLNATEFDFTIDSQKTYGVYTSKGMLDISMLKTYSKIRYQSHAPAILSEGEIVNQEILKGGSKNYHFFNASKWTSDYHASPIYVVHPVDGYRGSLKNVVAVNSLNLLETDILRENVGTDIVPVYQEYKPFFIHRNGGKNFLSNASNGDYIIAIRIK